MPHSMRHVKSAPCLSICQSVPVAPCLRSQLLPDLQAELAVDNNETSARMVKARLEKTVLGQVTAHIKAVLQPAASFISIRLDLEVIAKLQLTVTPHSVGTALLKHSKLKLKTENIRCIVHSLPPNPRSMAWSVRLSSSAGLT